LSATKTDSAYRELSDFVALNRAYAATQLRSYAILFLKPAMSASSNKFIQKKSAGNQSSLTLLICLF